MNYNRKRLEGLLETITILYNNIDNDIKKQLNFIQAIENKAYKSYTNNHLIKKTLLDVPF